MPPLEEFLQPRFVWLYVAVALFALEFLAPGLIIFFFAIGACVTAAVCFFVDIGLDLQLVIFIISSVGSLLGLRRWFKGIFLGHAGSRQSGTRNLEDFVGNKAVVKKNISPSSPGKVEFHGTDWNAEADEEIDQGSIVEIVDKYNLTLKVKAV